MRIIQIIGLIVGIYLLYKSYSVFKQEKEDVNSFILWFLLGLIITVISFNLNVLDFISGLLRMEKNPNTVFTLGIFVLFVILFKLYSRLEELDKHVSKLNEEVSIRNYRNKEED